MKFSEKMCLMIISTLTKKHVSTPSVENAVLQKPEAGQINSPLQPLVFFSLNVMASVFCLALQKIMQYVN